MAPFTALPILAGSMDMGPYFSCSSELLSQLAGEIVLQTTVHQTIDSFLSIELPDSQG